MEVYKEIPVQHLKNITRPPAKASDAVDTITETKIEAKESAINTKAG